MKNPFIKYPDLSRFILCAILVAASLTGSGFIHLRFVPAGLLLVIVVTWLMFRSENKNLGALGFNLHPKNLLLLPVGLLLGAGAFLLSLYTGTLVRGGHLVVNPHIDVNELIRQLWNVLPTAAVQDFIIVGYCYYKLILLTNRRVATFLFGIFFISMHDVWGENIVNDLFYASTLFVGYLMFSTAFLRSGSIWLPIGIHWGNNFTNSYLFTFGYTKTSWLYVAGRQQQNLGALQAIELFIALNICGATVIAIVMWLWKPQKALPQQYRTASVQH